MEVFVGELIGTAILILLGNGVVANVVLKDAKGNSSGWIVITFGWGMAVAMAVYVSGWMAGAHLNPAVTIGLAAIGDAKSQANLLPYLGGQMIGAMCGQLLVYLTYYKHFENAGDPDGVLACFSTGPAIRSPLWNFITEFVGTAMLLIGILGIGEKMHEGGAGAALGGSGMSGFLVGMLVFSIGLSLGGPTGYAINPARDLGPRIMHQLLPIPGKRDSDWGYSWIPVVAPILGGVVGTLLYTAVAGIFPVK